MAIALVITVLGVILVGRMIDPTYEAKAAVLLLNPSTGNQYVEFPAGLEITADALVVVLQSEAGAEKLKASGATATFSLERSTGPLVIVTAKGSSEEQATLTVTTVIDGLRAELAQRQASSAPDLRITVDVLTEPSSTVKLGSRIRAQAAAGALGLTMTVTAGLSVDAIRRQRQARRHVDPVRTASEPVVPDSTPRGVDPPPAPARSYPSSRSSWPASYSPSSARVRQGANGAKPPTTDVQGTSTDQRHGGGRRGANPSWPAPNGADGSPNQTRPT